ncbi:DUF4915 domain-containing protein [Pseudomonas sp. UL073]|uniref:DUF4915 domain-containing protein n=1 Tax=Zestomonas insulae TaxID=2809017 RepID=A0ABS2ILB0_9GAMM|nr:DUF4915 domain-containing protein [Pseudomonas insulae]MBM7063164.1 DUF4915 domain-containing protein [Pseudomonas insulae]
MITDTLLVSSPGQDGGLILIDQHSQVRIINRPITGICLNDHTLLYAFQDNGGNTLKHIHNGLTKEITLTNAALDLHDVFCKEENTYLAATETNSVLCLNKDLKQISQWGLPGENDSAHLNSTTWYQGKLLASIFGRFQKHREYKNGTQGIGEVIDIQTGNSFIRGLSQPHSLTVVEDLLYLCSSEDQELRIYRGQELLKKIQLPGYVRGLAIGTTKIYAGLSLSRNTQTAPQADSASIAVLNRASMAIEGFVNVASREIYDIRITKSSYSLLSNLNSDLLHETRKLEELVALYRHGYESYLCAYKVLLDEVDALSNRHRGIIAAASGTSA